MVFPAFIAVLAGREALEIIVNRSDSSYSVHVGGSSWLHSGGLRFFANGEWHGLQTAPSPPPSPICSDGRPGTDIAVMEGVFRRIPNATSAVCCRECRLVPRACNAWVLTTADEGDIPAGTCFLVEGARGLKRSSGRTSQIIDPSRPSIPAVTGLIKMTTPPVASAGTDRFGTFKKVTTGWTATNSRGDVSRFATSIRTYRDGRTAVFEQSVPQGARHTNYRNVTFADVRSFPSRVVASVDGKPRVSFRRLKCQDS